MNKQEMGKDTGMCPHGNFPATCDSCKEVREKSWHAIEAFIARLEKIASPERLKTVEQLKPENEKGIKKTAEDMEAFFERTGLFDPEEVVDRGTHEVNLRENITRTYVQRDKGEIVSWLDHINVTVPPDQEHAERLMFTTWYIFTDPNYQGTAATKELYLQALKNFLAEAKAKQIETLGITGETEPEVERLLNRFGAKRMYTRTQKEVEEVPYVSPPEDEAGQLVPEHFMIYLADGRSEMSVAETKNIMRALHAEYVRPEFFTPELVAGYEEVDVKKVSQKSAQQYHAKYSKIAARGTQQLEQALDQAVDGKVMLMSKREVKALKEQGTSVKEIRKRGDE